MLPAGITLEQTGTCVTIGFDERDLSVETMQTAVNECAERMRYNNGRRIIIDLTGVEFMASACLNVLINFAQEVEYMRGRIAVAGASREVGQVFRVTHLDRMFGLYDDAQEAAAAI